MFFRRKAGALCRSWIAELCGILWANDEVSSRQLNGEAADGGRIRGVDLYLPWDVSRADYYGQTSSNLHL